MPAAFGAPVNTFGDMKSVIGAHLPYASLDPDPRPFFELPVPARVESKTVAGAMFTGYFEPRT